MAPDGWAITGEDERGGACSRRVGSKWQVGGDQYAHSMYHCSYRLMLVRTDILRGMPPKSGSHEDQFRRWGQPIKKRLRICVRDDCEKEEGMRRGIRRACIFKSSARTNNT